ncbi:MAG: hypothetical protein ACM3QY_04445 [Candidatus Levyibacteriota bacterium]
MTAAQEAKDALKSMSMADVQRLLASSPDGLARAEAERRLTR